MDENSTYNPFEGIYTEHFVNTFPSVEGVQLDFDEINVQDPSADQNVTWEERAIIAVFLIVVASSLLLNVYFFVLLLTLRSVLTKSPFFSLVGQLSFANIISAVANIVRSFPFLFHNLFTSYRNWILSPYYQLTRVADNFADQLVLYCFLFIAVHRFFIFVLDKYEKQVFGRRLMIIYSILIWILSLVFSGISFIFTCSFKYTYIQEHFEYQCIYYHTDETEFNNLMAVLPIVNVIMHNFVHGQIILFPLISLICYTAIFFYIQRTKSKYSKYKTEKIILYQGLILFFTFEFAILFAYLMTNVQITPSWAFTVNKIVNSIELLAGALTPIFLIYSSSAVNKAARRPFSTCFKKKTPKQLKVINNV